MEKIYYNTKILTYRDGRKKYVFASKNIFTPPTEYKPEKKENTPLAESLKKPKKEKTKQLEKAYQDRSEKRAKDNIFDLIYQNDFSHFYTITFDPKKIETIDPQEISKKIQTFLNHAVTRKGLQYVLVAERHKKGGIHLHFLGNNVFTLVDSGTRILYGKYKKPVTLETIQKRKIPPERIKKIVYNVKEIDFGFTTAIETDGDPYYLASYVTKYVTKDMKKIFGKYYWHSRNLVQSPEVEYTQTRFQDVVAQEHESPVGTVFKYKSEFTKVE